MKFKGLDRNMSKNDWRILQGILSKNYKTKEQYESDRRLLQTRKEQFKSQIMHITDKKKEGRRFSRSERSQATLGPDPLSLILKMPQKMKSTPGIVRPGMSQIQLASTPKAKEQQFDKVTENRQEVLDQETVRDAFEYDDSFVQRLNVIREEEKVDQEDNDAKPEDRHLGAYQSEELDVQTAAALMKIGQTEQK